jgi:membrane protein insertase, YidC/Oxa1 family, C-terminal domain
MSLDIIARPLGEFLLIIYNALAFHNYGLSILIFTLVVKLVLLPLTVKQYRSSAKMRELQPLIEDAQKRYKNDKEKLNQEVMKIYQENNYNPAGGCLPLLVQTPILISLYYVVIQPLKFLLHKNNEQIKFLVENVQQLIGTKIMGYQEVIALNYYYNHQDALNQVSGYLNPHELINMNFLGLHLGEIPSYATSKLFGTEMNIYLPILFLAIVAMVTTFISTRLSMNMQKNGSQPIMTNSMTNSMMYVGPIMTLIFAFQVPASASLYWSISNIFTIFQQIYINMHVIGNKAITDTKMQTTVIGGVNNNLIINDCVNKENTSVDIIKTNKGNPNNGGSIGKKKSGKKNQTK